MPKVKPESYEFKPSPNYEFAIERAKLLIREIFENDPLHATQATRLLEICDDYIASQERDMLLCPNDALLFGDLIGLLCEEAVNPKLTRC